MGVRRSCSIFFFIRFDSKDSITIPPSFFVYLSSPPPRVAFKVESKEICSTGRRYSISRKRAREDSLLDLLFFFLFPLPLFFPFDVFDVFEDRCFAGAADKDGRPVIANPDHEREEIKIVIRRAFCRG